MASTAQTQYSDTLTDWLALHHAPGIGAMTCQRLLAELGSPAAIRRAPAGQLQSLGIGSQGIEALHAPDQAQLERALAWQEAPDNHIISLADSAYPALLRQIADPPAVLYAHGNPALLDSLQLALVGSRNPTPVGRQTAEDFARHLSLAGLVITSGLAAGIDAAAHSGALAAGKPTIAVMGTGLVRDGTGPRGIRHPRIHPQSAGTRLSYPDPPGCQAGRNRTGHSRRTGSAGRRLGQCRPGRR
jgi:DNA processing protein